MKNAHQYIRSALIAMLLGLSGESAMAQLIVVVSTKSTLTALSEQQIADIFLGRAAYFPGGGSAIPVDLPEDAAARSEFYRRITGKSSSQMKAYWSKLIFTGRGQPPREVQDPAAIKRALAETPNAIGYMDSRDIDASVKPLLTLN
ncbi:MULTISPECIES: type 2 periplasmic-binding domain-containing protein [Burkholderiaceae]|nr:MULTISPECIES: phosphate ABC transporter substrate-binding protein [Burkholderiaceae]